MKKSMGNTVSIVSELVAPIAKELSLILWDVQFEKEGASWVLRIIIDKEGGVSLEDCEALSRPLDKLLDEKDPIEQSYSLEVSSAGIERALTKDWHFAQYISQKVMLRLIRPYNGERDFLGELLAYENAAICINGMNEKLVFNMSDVAFVKLYAEF